MAILTVRGLSKTFGELSVLQGVDLTVEATGVHSLIGPNGAGKSTLFNCVSGYLKPDEGRVEFDGEDVSNVKPIKLVRKGLARTFQISSVFPTLSAKENVDLSLVKSALGGRLGLRTPRAVRRSPDESARLLALVGLERHLWFEPAGALSHGDARSLEVAMALASGPKLLCLDEPTAGMGIGEAEFFGEMIKDLSSTTPVLLVEHRIEMVLALSKRITVLAAGKVIASGTPSEIGADQQVKAAYLGVVSDGVTTA